MGAAAESVTHENEAPTRRAKAGAQPAAPATSGFDPFVQRFFGATSAKSPDFPADALTVPRFRVPVLQRAQRLYGNRASQQIVMRSQVLQRQCACGGTCAKCQEEERQRTVQRSSAAPGPSEFDGIPNTTGEQLDPASRHPLEAHFGADLADVRVHTGSEAASSAVSLDALAYTAGRDIYFAPGMYAPSSDSGRRLLAHEVAHVVQQSSGKEPTLATKSSQGAKIGAPDDPLESEADRAAEQFMSAPLTDEEERKKHESSYPVQRFVQRQEVPSGAVTPQPAPPAPLGPVYGPPAPLPPGTYFLQVGPWTFSTDPKQLKDEIFKVVGEMGIFGADWVLNSMFMVRNLALCNNPAEPSQECMAWAISKDKVIEVMVPVVDEVRTECKAVIADFERKMKLNVDNMLYQNKKETKEEMAKYGIEATQHEVKGENYRDEFGSHPSLGYSYTDYGMQTQSDVSLELSDAAKILLDRANAINEKKNEQNRHIVFDPADENGYSTSHPDDQYDSFTPIIEQMERDYKKTRLPLENKFPVLAPFADKKDSPEGLATLANKDKSNADAKAKLVGEKLQDTVNKIETVQAARRDDDLNVWRLDQVFNITKLQNDMDHDPVRNKLVDEKYDQEKPGMLSTILQLAISVLGIIFAAPTGGLSLVLSAGIGAAIAVQDVREYLIKDALSGSGLGAAKALSQDEPSLFWLAVEVVGVGLDVGAAAGALTKTFAKLAKLAKTAEAAAKGTEEAADALKALKEAAANEKNGEALVARIEQHFESATREGDIVGALGQSEEVKDLAATARAADEAAKAAESAAVPTAKTLAGGEVKATRFGLFSCHSPCTILREKFIKELALREDLNKQLLELEAELVAKQGDEVALKSIAERAAKVEDELRQTLTFKPEAYGKPGFNDLLKQRGSGSEKLLNKPPSWTGAQEASFKFGDKAVLDAEQAEKYYWRLDSEGTLSLIRKDTKFPKLRFDPSEGKFIEVEDTVIRAEYVEDVVPKGTDKGVYSQSKLKAGERKEFDAIMNERKSLTDERDNLQKLDEAGKLSADQEERLSTVRGLINRRSEELGNKAAQRYMESLNAAPVHAGAPGQSGVFDQIWKTTEKLPNGETVEKIYVVEAKGGGSRLGTRMVDGVAAEQGTPQYFESILDTMPDGELKTNMRLAHAEGRVTYLKVQAPIGTKAGQDVLSDFRIAVFKLVVQ